MSRPSLKSDAEAAIKGIEGMERVDNQIEVLPPSPSDDRLRLQLFEAIYGYPSLQRYALPVNKAIRIIVNAGHARLEGVVDNEGDKDTAGIRAKGVPGLFSVDNNLQIEKQIANRENEANMKNLMLGGVVLLIVGILSFVVPVPHREDHGIKIGNAKIGVQTESSQRLPPVVGGVLLAGGVLLIAMGSKER